jgi:hypothetical protein
VNSGFLFGAGLLEVRGGPISGLANLVVPSSGEFRVRGVHQLSIAAAAGSTIAATGNLTLGDATKVNGFYSNGTVEVGANSVTLADANDVAFDSAAFVTLGDGGSPGTLVAANGLTLDFAGNIAGVGTVDTPDDVTTPLTNNGHITGNSSADPIILTGYVKGVGTLDNVIITGTSAPGFSPATVFYGSVTYAGTLEIELAASGLDVIHHSGTATLSGELDVALVGGFMPALNSTFEIITAAGGVSGMFDTLAEELPALSPGLAWDINYSANNVVLAVVAATDLAGDYNGNGTVDVGDYTVWRNSLGQMGAGLAADGNHNNQVDSGDFNVWKSHYGDTASGSGSAGAASTRAGVPEPASFVLLLLAATLGVVPLWLHRP